MFQIRGDVEVVGFPGQNVYKMMYGDENATFEPLNLWTRERLLVFLPVFLHEVKKPDSNTKFVKIR